MSNDKMSEDCQVRDFGLCAGKKILFLIGVIGIEASVGKGLVNRFMI